MPKKSSKIHRRLIKWHYWVGALFAATFVGFAITGVLINHSHDWSLDSKTIAWPWLNRFYGYGQNDVKSGFPLNSSWVYQLGHALYLAESKLGECHGKLIGAAQIDRLYYVACANELLITLEDGTRVESIGLFPETFDKLAVSENILYAQNQQTQRIYRFNEEHGQWLIATPFATLAFQQATALPAVLLTQIPSAQGAKITWERLLLDLHSGRLFGRAGVFIADLIALALIFSSISGLWMWLKKRRNTAIKMPPGQ